MEQKQRFFIYDRKEMGVLLLLGVMVAIFAFTLGVHLGKRVGSHTLAAAPADADSVPTVPDKIPNRQELTEQSKGAQQAADESLNQALHDEVARTGIQVDTPHQVKLPEKPVSENAGATTGAAPQPEADAIALHRPVPVGKFTLQIGSYPTMEEARDQADSLEALGLKPVMRPADVKGKRWYRLFAGNFNSKELAEKAGAQYVSQHMIDAFIVSKMVDQKAAVE